MSDKRFARITKADVHDCTMTMRSRLANFLHKIAAAERKARPPSWTRSLPWNGGVDNAATNTIGEISGEGEREGEARSELAGRALPPTEGESAAPKDHEEKKPRYFVGFDSELFFAARCKKVGGVQDVSLPIVIDPRSKPRAPIVARWCDGAEHAPR